MSSKWTTFLQTRHSDLVSPLVLKSYFDCCYVQWTVLAVLVVGLRARAQG